MTTGMRVGKIPLVRTEGSDDWWSVFWVCPDHPTCGYQRTFKTKDAADALLTRLVNEGCPNSPWYEEERP